MAEELHLDVVTTAESAGLHKAAEDLQDTRKEADKLGDSFEHMGDSADHAGHSVHGLSGEAKTFTVEIEKSTKKLKEMEGQLLSLGNDKNLRKAIRAERSWLAELTKSAEDLAPEVAKAGLVAGSSFSVAFSQAAGAAPKAAMPALIAGLVAGVGALLPGLGAMLGGTLAGATATAAMAAGILSASKDAGVRDAARHFGADISHEFFASDAFVQPTIDALDKLGTTFKSINIGSSLAKLAPTVTVIADGIGRLVTNFMPGFNKFLDRMGPFARVAAEGLADTGQALGDFLAQITKSPGALEGLKMFFKITDGLIIMLGQSIQWLSDRFHQFVAINARVFGDLEDVFDVLGADKLRNLSTRLNNLFEGLMGGSSSGVVAIAQMKDTLSPFTHQLQEAEENTRNLDGSLQALFNHQMGMRDATIGYQQAIDDLTESVKANGTSLDIGTQKGRDNARAIEDAFREAIRVRDEMATTQGVDAANAAYAAMVAEIVKIGTKAGLSKAALEALAKPYQITVTTTFREVGHPPSFLQGNLSQGAQDASHRAAGGPVMPGVPYRINERGSETVTFPARGQVHPANLTPMGTSQQLSARPVRIDGAGLGELVFEWLREQISAKGGTLAVLNLKAP